MGSTARGSGGSARGLARNVLVLVMLASAADAQAGGELVWTHTSGASGWIGRVVSIGDRSAQVLTSVDGFSGTTRLYSSFSDDPATPAWQTTPAYLSYLKGVDSAELVDAHVSMDFVEAHSGAPRRAVVKYFDSSSPTPAWTHTLPIQANSQGAGVHITADGLRIVAWAFDPSANKTSVVVFGPGSSVPIASTLVTTMGEPLKVRMAANGSALYIVSILKTIVFDLGTSTVLHDTMNWESVSTGHAISGDGSVFAKGLLGQRVDVFRRQGSTYSLWFSHSLGATGTCTDAVISEDATTLAIGSTNGTGGLQTRIQVVDLVQTSHPVVFQEIQTGDGSYTNTVTSLSMSSRADVLALGVSGDQAGLVPELLVYRKSNGAWSRSFTHDLPGSVNQVDVSADGTRLAVASKTTHLNVMSGGGRIDLFSVGTRDLWMEGTPRAGSTVVIKQRWSPGTASTLLAAPLAASVPRVFPGIGTLHLRRTSISSLGTATADSSGIISTAYTIPQGAGGTTINFQALASTPRTLSRDWLHIAVLP